MVMKFRHVLGTCEELLTTYFSCMFTSRETFHGKRGARDTFFHHEDTVDVDTSFQQCKTPQRYQTRKQVRGGGRTRCERVDQKSIGMWGISNIRVTNQYYSF